MYRISNFGWMPFSGVTVPLTRKHLMGGIIPLKIPLVALAIYAQWVRKYGMLDASSIMEISIY